MWFFLLSVASATELTDCTDESFALPGWARVFACPSLRFWATSVDVGGREAADKRSRVVANGRLRSYAPVDMAAVEEVAHGTRLRVTYQVTGKQLATWLWVDVPNTPGMAYACLAASTDHDCTDLLDRVLASPDALPPPPKATGGKAEVAGVPLALDAACSVSFDGSSGQAACPEATIGWNAAAQPGAGDGMKERMRSVFGDGASVVDCQCSLPGVNTCVRLVVGGKTDRIWTAAGTHEGVSWTVRCTDSGQAAAPCDAFFTLPEE